MEPFVIVVLPSVGDFGLSIDFLNNQHDSSDQTDLVEAPATTDWKRWTNPVEVVRAFLAISIAWTQCC